MFKNVLVGLKEELQPGPLLDLTQVAAPPPATIHLVTLVRTGVNEDRDRLAHTERNLEVHAAKLRSKGYEVSCEVGILVVAAAADLLSMARQREVDLMVIGLAKRSRVGKALLGSDAQRVLLGAHCPVLVTQLFGA